MAFIPSAQAAGGFAPLTNALDLLEQFGFFQVILPVLLIYAIVYGILLKTQLFGNPQDEGKQPWVKPVSGIVAFSIAFFVVSSTDVVTNINRLIPQSAFMIVIAVLLLMMLSMFGVFNPAATDFWQNSRANWVISIIIIFVFLGVIDAAFNFQIPVIHQLVLLLTGTTPGGQPLSDETLSTLIGFLLVLGIPIALIIWMSRSTRTTQ